MRKAIILILLSLSTTPAIACRCRNSEPFLSVYQKTKIVSVLKVIRHLNSESIEAEIIEVLNGKEDRRTIIVWGDNGMLCRPYVTEFKDGEIYAMALYAGNTTYGNKNEKESDYYVSSCGAYSLKVKGRVAKGKIAAGKTRIKLRDLKSTIAANTAQ